jgi:transcriptional regulator with XRE-family HTH domain
MYNFNLMKRIKERGMTQKEFAKKVKVSGTLVSLVITGKYNLERDRQERFAKALETSVEELFPEMVVNAR